MELQDRTLYSWFGTRHLDSVSPIGTLFHRALAAKQLEYNSFGVVIPENQGKAVASVKSFPALIYNQKVIRDFRTLMLDLASENPTVDLMPSEEGRRLEAFMLADWAQNAMGNNLHYFRFCVEKNYERLLMKLDNRLKHKEHLFAINDMKKRMIQMVTLQPVGKLDQKEALLYLRSQLDYLKVRLDGQPFFFDSKLTIADLSIFAILQGFLDPGIAESEMIQSDYRYLCRWAKSIHELTQNKFTCEWTIEL